MYIWVGIDVDSQFSEIKEKAKSIDKELEYINSCFTLPMHISIKISFEIKDEMFDEIIDFISAYYQTLSSFEIKVKQVEKENGIVWIRYEENSKLSQIKDEINRLLKDKYDIGMHEYDYDFIFHTTLFMEDNEEKNRVAYEQVKNVPLPKTVLVNRFAIGKSPNGKLGTCVICKEIVK